MDTEKVRRVLLTAFHFPPAQGSSGIQRTLNFSRYLPENGWEPIVLSAQPSAYPSTSNGQMDDIDKNVIVRRALAWDTSRHLAIKGRYVGAMAYPDRWISWWLGGVLSGLKLIRKHKPDVIWSTYPIATAHLIGLTLHRLTSIPWIADFRDSMTEDDYPPDPSKRAVCRWIERRAVKHAAYVVFTSPGTVNMYRQRYPNIIPEKWTCILNGYDEENFKRAATCIDQTEQKSQKRVLLHSGLLYLSERDPRDFFAALSELYREGTLSPENLVVRLRASGAESILQNLVNDAGISSIVKLEPAINYNDALAEMLTSDGLLIFQASNCNHQIPAKVYEYMRARRPILALTDPVGDTAGILRKCGIDTVAPLNSKEEIKLALTNFLSLIDNNAAHIVSDEVIEKYSRRSQTGELAKLCNSAQHCRLIK